MTTIYTNENNPAAFKLIIAACYSETPSESLEVHFVEPQGK